MSESKMIAALTPYKYKLLLGYAGILFLLLCVLISAAGGAEEVSKLPASSLKTQTVTPETPVPEKNLVDFFSYITDLSKSFVDLENQIDESVLLDRFQDDISEMFDQIQLLSRQISTTSAGLNLNDDQLEIIETKVYKLGYRFKKVNTPLLDTIGKLSDLNTEWVQKKETLDSWAELAHQNVTFKMVEQDILDHQRKVDLGLELILKKLKPALAAQKEAFELEINIHSLTQEITTQIQMLHKKGGEKLVPFFSTEFYSQMNKELWVTIWKNIAVAAGLQRQLFAEHFKSIFFLCLVFSAFSILIHRSKNWVEASADWYLFAERPAASAAFLCLAGLALVNFFNENGVQIFRGMEPAMRILILLTIIRLSSGLLETLWKKRLFSLITISVIMIEFFKLMSLPQVVFYLYSFFVTILIMGFCLWQNRHLSQQKISFFGLLGLRSGAFMLFCILALLLSGYQDLALYLFISLLTILIYVFIFWMLFLATKSILELLLFTTPLKIAQKNSSVIVSQLTPVIIVFYFYILFILALQFLGIYPTQEAAMEGLQSFNLAAGSWVISPGTLLNAVLTIYLIYLFSKVVQGLLLQEVLPRYNAAKGVRFSIVRLVNYAILAIGFILVLDVLGFELTSLTIFGGALGIGVGFGLQAIVTNVASGLILLFERPIKVGDTIQVNNEFGEIKTLGLRATVVETYDNAEIVIPNSDLVTGQVTNWTLAERRTRVKVPIGVAYGTDTTKVLEILMSCADESPMVLSDPSPNALFLSFGESSLDFELRVWIPEFNDRMTVLSELNQEINTEFKLAGIEIPFPQRDLHICSVSETQ